MHTPALKALVLRTTGLTYPGTIDQARAVRADLRGLLDGCPMADDVILCASEMAANAALHSRSRLPGGQFTVRAEIHPGDYIWIEVEDNGGPWLETAPDSGRSHGLDLIRALASEWAIDGDSITRIVWARFDWSHRH
jgi:serine/threonine-protein kinase RsbW